MQRALNRTIRNGSADGRETGRALALLAGLLLLGARPAAAQQVLLNQSSDPPGFFVAATYYESGTNVLTTNVPLQSAGFSFTHWTVNGTRQTDPLGRARNPVRFPIYENTDAVAYYLPTTNDVDGDAIPDWFETMFYNSQANEAGADTDGDGCNLDEEYRLDDHPGLRDELQPGGVARRRSALATLVFHPELFFLTQRSAPLGFVDSRQVVSNGVTAALTNLNGEATGFWFGGWDIEGVRQADVSGRALPRPLVTVTNHTVATAHYYAAEEDTDIDGLPDWWEWLSFGRLAYGAAEDPDGDGLDLDHEFRYDTHPGMGDDVQAGGVARRRSALVDVNLADFCPYSIVSRPPGFVTRAGYAVAGTVISTPTLNGESAGYMFGYWTVNGARQCDLTGRALNRASFTITAETEAMAWYFSKTEDLDSDGIADWWEWQNFGHLEFSGVDDPDGDGLSMESEYRRDGQPNLKEYLLPGGVVRRRSPVTAVNMEFFERMEYALVGSVLTNFFTVWPTNVRGYAFSTNTAPAAGDWDGNGTPDLFVGSTGGVVTVFENMGTRYTLNLTNRTAAFTAYAVGWSGTPNPAPALGDWNNDGRADLAVGGDNGRVRLVMSPGHFQAPRVTGVEYDLAVTGTVQAIPAFGDLDRDGRPELLVLCDGGIVRAYTNTGNAMMPFIEDAFVPDLLQVPVIGGAGIGVADVNYDGRLDVLVSDKDGRIWDFRGAAGGSFTLKSKVWAGSGRGMAQRLTIGPADTDGDGDVDTVGGFAGGGLMCLRDPRLGIPSGLRAINGANSIRLEWTPNREYRIKGYWLYRATDAGGPFQRMGAEWLSEPLFLDESVTIGQTNYYRVASVTHVVFPGTTRPVERESLPSEVVAGVAGSVQISMPPEYVGAAGLPVVLPLQIGNGKGIVGDGMEIRLSYDPAVIRPVTQIDPQKPTVEKTVLTSALAVSDNGPTANGELVIQATGGAVEDGNGRLFDIVWQVNADAQAGQKVTNAITAVTLKDATGHSLAVEAAGVAVLTVQSSGTRAYFRGDVDGNGVLEQDDFVLAMKLAVGQREPTADELMAGDLNGNGRIDKDDAHLILRLVKELRVNP